MHTTAGTPEATGKEAGTGMPAKAGNQKQQKCQQMQGPETAGMPAKAWNQQQQDASKSREPGTAGMSATARMSEKTETPAIAGTPAQQKRQQLMSY